MAEGGDCVSSAFYHVRRARRDSVRQDHLSGAVGDKIARRRHASVSQAWPNIEPRPRSPDTALRALVFARKLEPRSCRRLPHNRKRRSRTAQCLHIRPGWCVRNVARRVRSVRGQASAPRRFEHNGPRRSRRAARSTRCGGRYIIAPSFNAPIIHRIAVTAEAAR